ncbi:MAG: hypothetical protein IT168_20330 [Bryobacterales bacterium]|nr:hypothetical protein [Bryobacterales bacterium]
MPEQDQTGRKWAAEIRITITVPPDWTAEEDQQLAAKLERLRTTLTATAATVLPARCVVNTEML